MTKAEASNGTHGARRGVGAELGSDVTATRCTMGHRHLSTTLNNNYMQRRNPDAERGYKTLNDKFAAARKLAELQTDGAAVN